MKMVPMSISRSVATTVLKSKKNSPHIFFGAGVAGFIGTVVLSSCATMKLEPVLDEIKEDFETVTNMSGYNELGKEKYSASSYRKDVGYVYLKGAAKIGKLYAPTIVVGGLSIAALTGSHVQLTRRNAALTATLAAAFKAWEEYRERVREEVGESRELDIYHGVEEKVIEIDGKKKKVKEMKHWPFSSYAFKFDAHNQNWQPLPELNRNFLQCVQNHMNQRLQARGHVFLNDIFDALGMERTKAGSICGWVRNGDGDNYIDLGIFEAFNSPLADALDPEIWLDPNLDGIVYELIEDA